MIHRLSRATSYLQTFYFDLVTGKQVLRSYATGFFIRLQNSLLLVTNWHVVTGLDPAKPSACAMPPPQLLKATVVNKKGGLSELFLPLYDRSMEPLWYEHPSGRNVDLAVYPVQLELENHFDFVDLLSLEDDAEISETVARDVFILGYPFSRAEMRATFGDDAPYYLPVWKRGSIATEPGALLGEGVLLIDALSRAGMSGSPVLVSQDDKMMVAGNKANAEVFKRLRAGEGLDAILDLDTSAVTNETVKHYRFLGVYSGTIGSTRLAEVALGKCWHAQALKALIENQRPGHMPFHAPLPNEHYDRFLDGSSKGVLTLLDPDGEVAERVPLGHAADLDLGNSSTGWNMALDRQAIQAKDAAND